MTTLYQDEIQAIYEDFAWPNDFKPGLLAWSIAEQGRGTGPLYTVHNTHSLHWRDDLAAYYPNYFLLQGTGEVDNKYFSFTSFCQELGALRRFIHRKVYGDVDAHMGSIKELLTSICPAFCPRVGYVDYVLSLLPEAEAELRKIGWTPDGVPVPVPAPDPIPVPAPGEFHVTDGILTGPNVKYWWVKNHDAFPRPATVGVIFHEPDAHGTGTEVNGLGIVYDWSIASTQKSAHGAIIEDGTFIQTVDLTKPAWHCYGQNLTRLGFEVANIGPFWPWQEIFGWFYRFRNKPWEQKIRKSDMQLINGMYWADYTDPQIATAHALVAACEAFYGHSLAVDGHNKFDTQRVDPGPLFWAKYNR